MLRNHLITETCVSIGRKEDKSRPYLSNMTSTNWRKSSQVLYSRGSSWGRDQDLEKKDSKNPHVERVVFPHLAFELVSDPCSHLGAAFLVQPTQLLDLSDNPFLLALLRQDPSKASVICRSPEREVENKEDPRHGLG